jgi:hypothetical protein
MSDAITNHDQHQASQDLAAPAVDLCVSGDQSLDAVCGEPVSHLGGDEYGPSGGPETRAVVKRGSVMGLPDEFDGQLVFNPRSFMSIAARMNRKDRENFDETGAMYGIPVGADWDVPFGKVRVVRDSDGEWREFNFYIRIGLDGSAIPEISDRDPGVHDRMTRERNDLTAPTLLHF